MDFPTKIAHFQALNINPSDVWSTHATAHILGDTNRAEEGVKFMEKNEPYWGVCLAAHKDSLVPTNCAPYCWISLPF